MRGCVYGTWMVKSFKIGGSDFYNSARHLGYSIKWKKKRHGWHVHQDGNGWKNFIVSRNKLRSEQVKDVTFPHGARGYGDTHPVYDQWRVVFSEYEVKYQYRSATEVCEQWQEDWNEVCYLSHTPNPSRNLPGERMGGLDE